MLFYNLYFLHKNALHFYSTFLHSWWSQSRMTSHKKLMGDFIFRQNLHIITVHHSLQSFYIKFSLNAALTNVFSQHDFWQSKIILKSQDNVPVFSIWQHWWAPWVHQTEEQSAWLVSIQPLPWPPICSVPVALTQTPSLAPRWLEPHLHWLMIFHKHAYFVFSIYLQDLFSDISPLLSLYFFRLSCCSVGAVGDVGLIPLCVSYIW